MWEAMADGLPVALPVTSLAVTCTTAGQPHAESGGSSGLRFRVKENDLPASALVTGQGVENAASELASLRGNCSVNVPPEASCGAAR